MTNPADLTGISGAAKELNDGELSLAQCTDPFRSDTYAWSAILLEDGRVISLAWLRNYPGATSARWRRYR